MLTVWVKRKINQASYLFFFYLYQNFYICYNSAFQSSPIGWEHRVDRLDTVNSTARLTYPKSRVFQRLWKEIWKCVLCYVYFLAYSLALKPSWVRTEVWEYLAQRYMGINLEETELDKVYTHFFHNTSMSEIQAVWSVGSCDRLTKEEFHFWISRSSSV